MPPHCMHLPNCRNGDRCWYNHLKHSFELNVGQDAHAVPLPAAPLIALPVAPPPAAPLLAAPLPAAPPPAAPAGLEPPCIVCGDTRADNEDEGSLFCEGEDGCGGRICYDCAEGENDYCYECDRCTGRLGDCCECGSASPDYLGQGYPGQGYPGQG